MMLFYGEGHLKCRESVLAQLWKERAIVLDGSKFYRSEQLLRSGGDMKSWYAVNTKTHCEAVACASLHRLGVEVFLPMLKTKITDETVKVCAYNFPHKWHF